MIDFLNRKKVRTLDCFKDLNFSASRSREHDGIIRSQGPCSGYLWIARVPLLDLLFVNSEGSTSIMADPDLRVYAVFVLEISQRASNDSELRKACSFKDHFFTEVGSALIYTTSHLP